MVQTLKNNIGLIISSLILALGLAFVPAQAFALDSELNIDESTDCGSNVSLVDDDCDVSEGGSRVQDTIRTIINIFSILVGAVAVIMIIFGGFRYITSGGDSNNIGSAKNTILYAIVGLIIVAIAQAVVQFVLNET